MIKQNTPEWLEMRKSKIGASDAPIIMQQSPWMTKFQLWEEKMGLREHRQTNAAMQKGHELEPIALEAYNNLTGNKAEPRVVFHEKYKWMMASLDGLSSDKSVIVEIKCPGKTDHDTAKEGKIPDKYYPQLQHQLATLGTNVLHYFSFRNGDFKLIEVERNDSYIERLLKEEGDFWKCLQNWEPPDLCDKDFTDMEKNEAWRLHSIALKEARENLDMWEEKESDAKNALIAMANGKSCIGCGIRLTKYMRRGSVDYGKIPELKGIDLDKYRKSSSVNWRIS